MNHMFVPWGPLGLDDRVAISSLYDSMVAPAGAARDVAVGANGDMWSIGTIEMGNSDYSIHKRVGDGWIQAGGGARRIAVGPTGAPWVVNNAGNIIRLTTNDPNTGFWEQMGPQLAQDIGVGSNGDVWIISRTVIPGTSDYQILKLGVGWVPTNGGAVKIAVGSNGEPYVVNSAGNIFRRNTNSPTSGVWEQIGGGAVDIGISESPYAYVVTSFGCGSNGCPLYVWNEQNHNFARTIGNGLGPIGVGPGATPVYLDIQGNVRFPTR
jgi:streptogramin lyase